MAETTKTTPAGPLREPLPAIYPIALIEVACRALEALREFAPLQGDGSPAELVNARRSAFRIIHDGLSSHERAAQEGRSRG